MTMVKLKRAYSPTEVLAMKIPQYEFDGAWEELLGHPAKGGTWLVWGHSGNGKSSFVMQLAKYFCKFGKVIYDSLEESTSLSFQRSLKRNSMADVSHRFIILDREPIELLLERLRKRKSPPVVIIDSLQYSGLSYNTYKMLKEEFRNKLFVFISHASGTKPKGRVAESVEYDVDVKIFVSGFKATCKSRFLDRPSVPYVIWEEGAVKYALGDMDEGGTENSGGAVAQGVVTLDENGY